MNLEDLGLEGVRAVGDALCADPESLGNDPLIEQLWAIKAMKYAETHFKLLQTCDPKTIKLTKNDDDIYEQFLKTFGKLKVDVINVDEIKSPLEKERWRMLCNMFDGKVKDFNFGTLLRIDASKEYSDENTTLVPRVQFLAIELARNRSGLNSCHFISS